MELWVKITEKSDFTILKRQNDSFSILMSKEGKLTVMSEGTVKS